MRSAAQDTKKGDTLAAKKFSKEERATAKKFSKRRDLQRSHGHDNRISLNILIRISFNGVEFISNIYFIEAGSTSIYLRHTGLQFVAIY